MPRGKKDLDLEQRLARVAALDREMKEQRSKIADLMGEQNRQFGEFLRDRIVEPNDGNGARLAAAIIAVFPDAPPRLQDSLRSDLEVMKTRAQEAPVPEIHQVEVIREVVKEVPVPANADHDKTAIAQRAIGKLAIKAALDKSRQTGAAFVHNLLERSWPDLSPMEQQNVAYLRSRVAEVMPIQRKNVEELRAKPESMVGPTVLTKEAARS